MPQHRESEGLRAELEGQESAQRAVGRLEVVQLEAALRECRIERDAAKGRAEACVFRLFCLGLCCPVSGPGLAIASSRTRTHTLPPSMQPVCRSGRVGGWVAYLSSPVGGWVA